MTADQTAAFVPAPVTQRDGSALANSNCRMASAAVGLSFDTLGAKTSTGSKMRSYTSDQSGGTDSGDAKQAWSTGYSEGLTVRDGHTFDDALADLRAGRLVHLDVWAASVGGVCLSGSGAYGHTIAVLPQCKDGKWSVADPWCSPPKWSGVAEAKLRAGAEEWGRRVYGTALMEADYPADATGPLDPRVLLIVARVVRALMTRAYPGNPERLTPPPPPPETGGGQAILFTVTAAHQGQEDDVDVIVTDAQAVLLDLQAGDDVLNLDGSSRTTVKSDRAGTFTSPFGGVTPGGTATRAIVWSRPEPDPDLLLACYKNQATNIRPIPGEDGGSGDLDPDAIRADRDAEWEDWLLEGAPNQP